MRGVRNVLAPQLGHAELATTQIYAAGLSERRRKTVMALEFAATPRAKTRKRLPA
jgi:site-specific recombinase XerD